MFDALNFPSKVGSEKHRASRDLRNNLVQPYIYMCVSVYIHIYTHSRCFETWNLKSVHEGAYELIFRNKTL